MPGIQKGNVLYSEFGSIGRVPKTADETFEEEVKVLPDYDNMGTRMELLPKAVYLLFLRHREGIPFKSPADYRDELTSIYMDVTKRLDIAPVLSSFDRPVNPYDNSINEKCSRIREAFVSRFDDSIARNYYVWGEYGQPKKGALDRNLIIWEG